MTKTLAELQRECDALNIKVESNGRSSKRPYISALRTHYWNQEHPNESLPEQVEPMLLSDWGDLTEEEQQTLENDHHGWCVQPKLDGVRVLLHVETNRVRITGRSVSDVTYRLTEPQENVPHLANGLEAWAGTIVDGELVCPVPKIDTGSTVTASALQAVVAILATTPVNAEAIQTKQNANLELYAFDVLRYKGRDVCRQPLSERLELLFQIVIETCNPFIRPVPTGIVSKRAIHTRVIDAGGEGTVWKQLDQPYEPGRRVKHWLKRKREIEIEAFVTGFRAGTADRGHRHPIGAVEFSTRDGDGATRPIAWVSAWSEEERDAMTIHSDGKVQLSPNYVGRRATIVGQDESARSRRIRHARLKEWASPC